ncbi:polysaccharide deacetylase family protein [Asticcacaulis benevestitus]|uniref:Chitooligosaccharide deacetylase n=1 Tax=Asticcacaulis benevestitus DSM 16100 = ATCC BAA-896 TaxID=1121022 RepID=V4P521_9CAUL|nr:polysaccharide deacetylase family protein [Asticcacaulis benevestitus]ESQ83186.1 hypothetical protein ABENE_20405 [Asticcacaulis benevestitus DSM 16100 = ATCC BAA-896]
MKLPMIMAFAIGLVAGSACTDARAQTPGFEVAITVDDLPAHGDLPPGVTREKVAADFLAALKAANVPEAYGFINGVYVAQDTSTYKTLQMWRDAGYPLGNHGFSHMNINDVGLAAFEGDIAGNEELLTSLMAGEDWHYLRFPFLAAGTDPTLHAGIMAYLKDHGYKIADVSINFNDWAYTDTYARCMVKGDQAAIEKMKLQYMAGVKASIAVARYGSQKVYGREIAHVLLLHEGAFTALMLPQVIREFEAEGARFVTLGHAERDAAYADDEDHAGDGIVIERKAREKGIDIVNGAPTLGDISNLFELCQ